MQIVIEVKTVWRLVAVAVLVSAANLTLPTAAVWLKGEHRPRVVFTNRSPDGQHEMVTTRRVALWGLRHPDYIYRTEVRDLKTGAILDHGETRISRDLEWSEPQIGWRSNSVMTIQRTTSGRQGLTTVSEW